MWNHFDCSSDWIHCANGVANCMPGDSIKTVQRSRAYSIAWHETMSGTESFTIEKAHAVFLLVTRMMWRSWSLSVWHMALRRCDSRIVLLLLRTMTTTIIIWWWWCSLCFGWWLSHFAATHPKAIATQSCSLRPEPRPVYLTALMHSSISWLHM